MGATTASQGIDELAPGLAGGALSVALADITYVAREGLLALSVATGMSVMQAMFEAEVTAVTGPKGKHDPDRTAVRHGNEKGSVTLGGRRVQVTRPRARTVDGHEVPQQSYGHFAADDLLSEVVLERMLAGVATRRHARIAEPVGKAVADTATSTGRSSGVQALREGDRDGPGGAARAGPDRQGHQGADARR